LDEWKHGLVSNARFADLLREYNAALVLTDQLRFHSENVLPVGRLFVSSAASVLASISLHDFAESRASFPNQAVSPWVTKEQLTYLEGNYGGIQGHAKKKAL
jgi:hypothetical protein